MAQVKEGGVVEMAVWISEVGREVGLFGWIDKCMDQNLLKWKIFDFGISNKNGRIEISKFWKISFLSVAIAYLLLIQTWNFNFFWLHWEEKILKTKFVEFFHLFLEFFN